MAREGRKIGRPTLGARLVLRNQDESRNKRVACISGIYDKDRSSCAATMQPQIAVIR